MSEGELSDAVDALEDTFAGVDHDLWSGDRFNVAPTRINEARRLKSIGFDQLTGHDLDYLMFKTMSTMGGVSTFKALLPRFLRAVLADPAAGWATDGEVLRGKLEMAKFGSWPANERRATAAALAYFAQQLIVLDADEPDVWALRDWAQTELARAS